MAPALCDIHNACIGTTTTCHTRTCGAGQRSAQQLHAVGVDEAVEEERQLLEAAAAGTVSQQRVTAACHVTASGGCGCRHRITAAWSHFRGCSCKSTDVCVCACNSTAAGDSMSLCHGSMVTLPGVAVCMSQQHVTAQRHVHVTAPWVVLLR